jgi:short-subunit dehydrogenase
MQRSVIITGGSSGIGLAITKHLLKNNNRVINLSRSSAKIADPLFQEHSVDLSQIQLIPKITQKLCLDLPTLDTLICNAGSGIFGNLEQLSFSQIDYLIQLNLTAQMYLTKGILAQLKKNRPANIIFIGSEAACQGKKQGSIYCASKFALRGFAQALREECATSHVKISIIHPGMVRTAFHDNLYFKPGPDTFNSLSCQNVAKTVEFILSMPEEAVCDEIHLSPLKKAVQFKKKEVKATDHQSLAIKK